MPADLAQRLSAVRDRTLALVAGLDDEVVHRPLDPIMSPLVWDLGHIAAYEDLWCVHRLAGEPLLHADLAATYDAFETPRTVRAEVELLDRAGALSYLDRVRDRTLDVLARTGPGGVARDGAAPRAPAHRDDAPGDVPRRPARRRAGGPATLSGRPRLVECRPARWRSERTTRVSPTTTSAPRHTVALDGYRIARTPVTNATWLSFAEGGGYQRREWWSDEGWSWKQCYDITNPLGWNGGPSDHPDAPVLHISWFEADAFARSQGARLPTEAEWERATTSTQENAEPPLLGVGAAWEWTSTEFAAYPGFRAHPYPEYSEVFFARGYRVLRGGSWATDPRVATPTFRNWDLPQRRQIFSGVRLAREL